MGVNPKKYIEMQSAKNQCVRSIGDTVNYKQYRYALHFDITTSPKGCEKSRGSES